MNHQLAIKSSYIRLNPDVAPPVAPPVAHPVAKIYMCVMNPDVVPPVKNAFTN